MVFSGLYLYGMHDKHESVFHAMMHYTHRCRFSLNHLLFNPKLKYEHNSH